MSRPWLFFLFIFSSVWAGIIFELLLFLFFSLFDCSWKKKKMCLPVRTEEILRERRQTAMDRGKKGKEDLTADYDSPESPNDHNSKLNIPCMRIYSSKGQPWFSVKSELKAYASSRSLLDRSCGSNFICIALANVAYPSSSGLLTLMKNCISFF